MRSSCLHTLRDPGYAGKNAAIAVGDAVGEQETVDHLESSPQANATKWARATSAS
jgi:subtilase family serine protease